MIIYIARRLLLAVSVLFAAVTLTFALFFAGPGSPAYSLCQTKCSTTRVAQIEHQLGLDRPKLDQFGEYLQGLAVGRDIKSDDQVIGHCDAPCLGWSYIQQQSVTTMVGQALPVTLAIVFGSMVIYVPTGLLLGILAGRLRGSPADRIIVGVSQVIANVPYYAIALILNLYLIFKWHLLPATQYIPLTQNVGQWFTGFLGIWLIFGIFNAMFYVRFLRTFMINTLSSDFVRTARSKGISERRVIWGHALRATLAPYLTLIGLTIAVELGGSIFTEQIFGVQGIGRLAISSIGVQDLPVVAGVVLTAATFVVLGNLIVDLLYVVVDPTVKLT